MPNGTTDKKFAAALKKASEEGVEIEAFDCFVTPDTIEIKDRVKVCLDI